MVRPYLTAATRANYPTLARPPFSALIDGTRVGMNPAPTTV
jgi:hypothetical protein